MPSAGVLGDLATEFATALLGREGDAYGGVVLGALAPAAAARPDAIAAPCAGGPAAGIARIRTRGLAMTGPRCRAGGLAEPASAARWLGGVDHCLHILALTTPGALSAGLVRKLEADPVECRLGRPGEVHARECEPGQRQGECEHRGEGHRKWAERRPDGDGSPPGPDLRLLGGVRCGGGSRNQRGHMLALHLGGGSSVVDGTYRVDDFEQIGLGRTNGTAREHAIQVAALSPTQCAHHFCKRQRGKKGYAWSPSFSRVCFTAASARR